MDSHRGRKSSTVRLLRLSAGGLQCHDLTRSSARTHHPSGDGISQRAVIDRNTVGEIIEAQFPQLRPVEVSYLGEGYDSTAFDVNGEFVFRFPKQSDVEAQLFIEI